MAQKTVSRGGVAALILTCIGILMTATSVRAQVQYPAPAAQVESASDRLGRYLRVLAHSPRDFQALIGAGRAALDLGDSQAAAGFFGRADEVWPTSPLPQAGMGAATVLEGDADGALIYFARAVKLGVTPLTIGADRGLAFDLLGRHAEAQADYRAALSGPEADEARRRLAISQAVSGNRDAALATLGPLLIRRDPAAVRTRAMVLALSGDMVSARSAIESAMPGSWAQMGPFIARFATLNSAQKAAAANLGIFPKSGQAGLASGSLASGAPAAGNFSGDRLAEIDNLLHSPPPEPVQQQPVAIPSAPALAGPVAAASAAISGTVTATPHKRYWVQLASGPNPAALPPLMRGIRSRSEDLLNGVSAYIAEEPGKARLLVGPFRNASDAEVFAEDLETLRVDAFRWISPEGQPIRKLTRE
jgi:Flp pilus assembly protein TadD